MKFWQRQLELHDHIIYLIVIYILEDMYGSNVGPLTNMSRLLQKIKYCSGENAEVLQNHLKQSKLKIKEFGVEPNSREDITVAVSSLTDQLGNWVAKHADEIL